MSHNYFTITKKSQKYLRKRLIKITENNEIIEQLKTRMKQGNVEGN